ncbi:hypothetical protein V6N13_059885 [Hibiscus sabdariffa]
MRKFIGELIDFGRGRGLSQSSNSVKEVFLGDKDDFVQGLEPDLPVCDGFASIEGSKIEFVACKGCRHKVRHMVDVIHRAQLKLWSRLTDVVLFIDVHVCCSGDFIFVKSMSEHIGCVGDRRGMDAFHEFMDGVGLVDLH